MDYGMPEFCIFLFNIYALRSFEHKDSNKMLNPKIPCHVLESFRTMLDKFIVYSNSPYNLLLFIIIFLT
jgi:hypothetical protein